MKAMRANVEKPASEPGLLQLRYRDDPWRMLVCCILLNHTQRVQVDRVVNLLFEKHPSCVQLANADEGELTTLLRPLGLQRCRAGVLKDFSHDWLILTNEGAHLPTLDALAACVGIGSYALDSYRLFVLDEWRDVRPEDKELRRWLARKLAKSKKSSNDARAS